MNSEVPLIAGGDDHHHHDDEDKDGDDLDDYGDLWGRPYFSLYFFEVLVDTPPTPIQFGFDNKYVYMLHTMLQILSEKDQQIRQFFLGVGSQYHHFVMKLS